MSTCLFCFLAQVSEMTSTDTVSRLWSLASRGEDPGGGATCPGTLSSSVPVSCSPGHISSLRSTSFDSLFPYNGLSPFISSLYLFSFSDSLLSSFSFSSCLLSLHSTSPAFSVPRISLPPSFPFSLPLSSSLPPPLPPFLLSLPLTPFLLPFRYYFSPPPFLLSPFPLLSSPSSLFPFLLSPLMCNTLHPPTYYPLPPHITSANFCMQAPSVPTQMSRTEKFQST